MQTSPMFQEIQSYFDGINARKGELFSAMLEPKLIAADDDKMEISVSFTIATWMKNVGGIVHGGITATYADLVMGSLARYILGGQFSPTMDMHVTYHRPVKADSDVLVCAKCVSQGRTVSTFSSQVVSAKEPEKVLVSVTGMYYTKKN